MNYSFFDGFVNELLLSIFDNLATNIKYIMYPDALKSFMKRRSVAEILS